MGLFLVPAASFSLPMAKHPITTPAQLRASVIGFNGTKNACYDAPFAFYMSYLETKKQTGDYTAMALAKAERAWILRQAAKLIKTHQRKQDFSKQNPITPLSPKSTPKSATREAKQATPPSDLWRTAYDIPLDYYLQRDE